MESPQVGGVLGPGRSRRDRTGERSTGELPLEGRRRAFINGRTTRRSLGYHLVLGATPAARDPFDLTFEHLLLLDRRLAAQGEMEVGAHALALDDVETSFVPACVAPIQRNLRPPASR